MCFPFLLGLCALLAPQGRVQLPLVSDAPVTRVDASGVWEKGTGLDEQILLQERADGSLLGYVAGTPGLYLVGGSRQGTDVILDFEGDDGGGIYDAGTFTGTLTREQLVGFFDDGSGPNPVTLVRSSAQLVEEHWLLIEADTSAMVNGSSTGRAPAGEEENAGWSEGHTFCGLKIATEC